jgi:nitroreductase
VSIIDVIKRRRSIGKMTEQKPAREQIEQILEVATYAPNHHRIEPWRFFVLSGKAREELGAVMATSLASRMKEITNNQAQAIFNKECSKPLRSPVLIVVAAERPALSKVRAIENVEAVAAAVQNMLLAAEEMGLACMWRTGDAAYDLSVKKWFGLSAEDHLVAFVYLGFPAISTSERRLTPATAKTIWLGWDEQ